MGGIVQFPTEIRYSGDTVIARGGRWVKRKEESTVKLPIVLEGNRREGYTATCPALPGCVSEGDTRQEAIRNIREAIRLYLRAVTREHILLKKTKTAKGVEALEVAV
jgi:predicted RNase H-like HicB family nuclease